MWRSRTWQSNRPGQLLTRGKKPCCLQQPLQRHRHLRAEWNWTERRRIRKFRTAAHEVWSSRALQLWWQDGSQKGCLLCSLWVGLWMGARWRGLSQVHDIIPETGYKSLPAEFQLRECPRPKGENKSYLGVLQFPNPLESRPSVFLSEGNLPLKNKLSPFTSGSVTLNLHSVRNLPIPQPHLPHTMPSPWPAPGARNSRV